MQFQISLNQKNHPTRGRKRNTNHYQNCYRANSSIVCFAGYKAFIKSEGESVKSRLSAVVSRPCWGVSSKRQLFAAWINVSLVACKRRCNAAVTRWCRRSFCFTVRAEATQLKRVEASSVSISKMPVSGSFCGF